jgi:flagellar hook-length control protein FliK
MNLGLIQAAAPASQPAPLTDAPASAESFKDAAAAFDAALSQTLSGTGGGAAQVPAPSNLSRTTQPAWLLASLFTATMAGSAPPAAASAEGATAVGDEREVPLAADAATSEDELADVVITPDAVIATAMPAVMPVVVPTEAGQPAADAEQAVGGESPASAPAATPGSSEITAKAPSAHLPAAHTRVAHAPVAHAAVAHAPAVHTSIAPAASGEEARDMAAVPMVSADTPAGIETAGGVEQAASASRLARPAATARPVFGDVVSPTAESPQQAAALAATAVAQVAAPDVPAAAALSTVTGVETRSLQAEGSPAAGFTVASQTATTGQDAPMTSQDQSNGQGRPTPEFMRFAAALAQVSPAAGDDAKQAMAAAVAAAPVAATPAAPAPAAAAAVTTAPAPAETPGPENVGRLVQAMRVIARPGAWEANLRLNPEHLGDVSIAIRVERNMVSAVVNAEGAGVRHWLESQEDAVRNGMAEHGLQLDRFIVQRDGQRRDAQPQQEQQGRRQPSRRHAAPTERFEIVV